MELKSLLETLILTPGICGYEGPVREAIRDIISPHVDHVEVDELGNLTAVIEGEGKGHLAFFAHMDELGLVITNVTADGFLRFKKMGGIDDRVLPSRHMRLYGQYGEIPGVIAWVPPHMTLSKNDDKIVPWHEMLIDVGAANCEEVQGMGIRVGDPAVFAKQISYLANGLIAARGMDNRAGCTALALFAQRARELKPQARLSLVFTTQEEYGLRGATVAGFRCKPDLAVIVDTGSSPDFPGVPAVYKDQFKLGKGPLLRLVDNRMIVSKAARDLAEKLGLEHGIPLQLGVVGGSTDAAAVQLAEKGIAVLPVCLPCRYTHATVEVVSVNDIEATIVLMERLAQSFTL